MKKPTISEIKKATQESNPYFFVSDTLKFFGQRLSSFKVIKFEDKIYIIAPTTEAPAKIHTIREFTGNRLALVSDEKQKEIINLYKGISQ